MTTATPETPKPRLHKTRSVVKFIVGTSTAWAVSNIVANNTSPRKRRHKAESAIAGITLGMMVAEASESWIDNYVDRVLPQVDKAKAEIQEALNQQNDQE